MSHLYAEKGVELSGPKLYYIFMNNNSGIKVEDAYLIKIDNRSFLTFYGLYERSKCGNREIRPVIGIFYLSDNIRKINQIENFNEKKYTVIGIWSFNEEGKLSNMLGDDPVRMMTIILKILNNSK